MPTDETITRTEIPEFLEASAIPLTSRLMPLLDPAQATDTSKFAPQVAAETALQQQLAIAKSKTQNLWRIWGYCGLIGHFQPQRCR